MSDDNEMNGPHADIVDGLLDLASAIDPSNGLHIEYPAAPGDESGQINDSDAEWIISSIDAIATAIENEPPRFEDRTARQWAERCWNLSEMIRDGDDMVFEIADKICRELVATFGEPEEEND